MKKLLALILVFAVFAMAGCSKNDNNPAAPSVDPPSGLTAQLLAGPSIKLKWTDASYNEAGFKIERAVGGSWSPLAEVGQGVKIYTDNSVAEGMTYSYRVRAYLMTSLSDPSNEASSAIPPRAPVGLTPAQDLNDPTIINLVWTDTSTVETGYEVQRRISGVGTEYATLDTLDANATFYQDGPLAVNTLYYYRVRTLMDTVTSDWSGPVSIRTTVPWPNAPSMLPAEVKSSSRIKLFWEDNAWNEDGMVVERSLSAGAGWAVADSLRADVESCVDDGLASETTYYYRVFAYNADGHSGYSNVVFATTPEGPPLPPSGLTVEAPSHQEVLLRWTDNSNDELGFWLQRHLRGTPTWTDLATTDPDVVFYIDNDVAEATEYYYHLNAFKIVDGDTLESTWTDAVKVNTPEGPPVAPYDLTATVTNMHEIALSWRIGSQNAEYILLERQTGNEDWFPVDDLSGLASGYTDTQRDINIWYKYRVKAINQIGESDFSNVDSAMTLALASPAVVDDGFESYEVDQPPSGEQWNFTIGDGTSWIRVSEANRHGGTKSLNFHDPDAGADNYAMMLLSLDQVGTGVISCWLFVPNNSTLELRGGDSNDNLVFGIRFRGDERYWFTSIYNNQAGYYQGGSYPVGSWFHFLVLLNSTNRNYSLSFNNVLVNESESYLPNSSSNVSMFVGVAFSDAEISDGYLDDLNISQISGGALLSKGSGNGQLPPPAAAVEMLHGGDVELFKTMR